MQLRSSVQKMVCSDHFERETATVFIYPFHLSDISPLNKTIIFLDMLINLHQSSLPSPVPPAKVAHMVSNQSSSVFKKWTLLITLALQFLVCPGLFGT